MERRVACRGARDQRFGGRGVEPQVGDAAAVVKALHRAALRPRQIDQRERRHPGLMRQDNRDMGGEPARHAGHRAGEATAGQRRVRMRSEEYTSELQSLMRISYAVFCLKTQTKTLFFPILPATLLISL